MPHTRANMGTPQNTTVDTAETTLEQGMVLKKHPTKYTRIFKYEKKTEPGWFYLVRFRNSRGKSSDKKGFTSLADARLWQQDNDAELRKGEYVSPTDGRVTVNAIVEDLLRARANTWKDSYKTNWISCWKARIQPEFGHRQVGKVTAGQVQDWMNELYEDGLASKTCSNYLTYLRGILNHATKMGAVMKNVARDATPPRKEPRRARRYLTNPEVKKVAGNLGEFHRAIFLTLVYTGLRWGELAGLEVGSVNLNTGRLTVRRSVSRVHAKDGGWQVGPPKNGRERRVGLPKHVIEVLKPYLKGKARTDLVFPPAGTSEFLDLPCTPGPGRNPTETLNWLWMACVAADVEPITAHGLRHSFASLSVSAGANVKVLQRALGHATAAMTLDVYSDLFEDDLDDVADKLFSDWNDNEDGGGDDPETAAPVLTLVG